MIQECEETSLDCETFYAWLQEYGLLAEIQDAGRYLVTTGLQYITLTQSPNRHEGILQTTTSHQTALLAAENNLLKNNWVIVKGFRSALSTIIRYALDIRYYNHPKHCILHYQNVQPRQYITHLKTVWVVMDERIRDELTKDFYCGWNEQEKHITRFARYLDDKQAKLQSDGLLISNINKLHHYML